MLSQISNFLMTRFFVRDLSCQKVPQVLLKSPKMFFGIFLYGSSPMPEFRATFQVASIESL